MTGSKFCGRDKGRVLVDCGLFQGLKELRERNWQDPPLILRHWTRAHQHAHIDHNGYLPRLVAKGFNNPVYCSVNSRPAQDSLTRRGASPRKKIGLSKSATR